VTDVLDRLKSALADRYAIEGELGVGGMATVYLAQDLKHERQVAVKVLRPDLAAVLGPERFLREIKIAAQLHHPHILPLYDSGEAEGFLYYVMPYEEGQSLRDRLTKEGELPVGEAVRLLRDVVDALSHAHQHGVVHRDIKPENILISGHHALVTDFGVAKAVSEATGREKLTTAGVALGTPTYMAPEQAAADPQIDHRADVYAVGVLGYELLTGHPPFTGTTPQAILSSHLIEVPEQVTKHRATVPPTLAQLIMRCLEKKPADRWQTADQLLPQLETLMTPSGGVTPMATQPVAAAPRARRRAWIAAVTTVGVVGVAIAVAMFSRTTGPAGSTLPTETPKLAVLPLENLGSSEDDYFADGITEEITSRIAEISGLRVISRQSAMQYKQSDKTLQQIGEELDVEYVLEGTVRTDRSPGGTGQVRVTSQLIRVDDDAHLWTDRYTADLEPGEIFRVQAEIAEQVAQALDVTLLERERNAIEARPTDNLQAYDFYLGGLQYFWRSSEEDDIQIAIRMFQKAVDLDPDFALGYARLAVAHSEMWWQVYDRTEGRLTMAREAADRALQLDPDLPEAHAAFGYYHYWGHLDYDRALAEFATAQRSQPNNIELFGAIGAVQRRQGKVAQALANFEKAAELDPRSAVMAYELAETHTLLRHTVEAERYYDRAIFLAPDLAEPYMGKALWLCLQLEGSTERARAVLEQAWTVGLAEDPWIAYPSVVLEIWDQDYQAALDRLALGSSDVLLDDQFLYLPKARLYAHIHGLTGNQKLERIYYDSARAILEARIRQHPDDDRLRSSLGIVYAGLGRREDAIQEGELAVELLPVSKEAWRGAYRLEDMARIYTMVGEYDAAIDQLEILLAMPSNTAVPMLRIDPAWNPLRDHPRFQALLEKYGN
jgi:serine/threonine-protein kinase